MSEDQLSALLAWLKADAGLQEKLKGAADLDAFLAIVEEAGFDVSKADWLRYQAKLRLDLSDEDLEGVAGGCAWESTGECGPMTAAKDCGTLMTWGPFTLVIKVFCSK